MVLKTSSLAVICGTNIYICVCVCVCVCVCARARARVPNIYVYVYIHIHAFILLSVLREVHNFRFVILLLDIT